MVIWNVAGALFPSAQPAPDKVIVTVAPATAGVSVQLLNPLSGVVVNVGGLAGTKALLKVTVMLPPAASAPAALVVKPTVQFATAFGTSVVAVNVTLVAAFAVITTAAAGEAGAASLVVATVKFAAAYDPAGGFVTPTTTSVAMVLASSRHVPPLSLSVIVTLAPAAEPVAAQFVNAAPRVIVGDAGSVKLG